MTNEELVRAALEKVGGKSNVLTATNCMTRLRVRVKDDAKIDDEGLKAIEGVMGIVHDRTGYVDIHILSQFEYKISIHAPHAGRDEQDQCPHQACYQFQSTRPMRGATMEYKSLVFICRNFNPRAPCGARPY